MSSAGTITELVLRWDELRQQGQHVTPEELCREHPDLLAEGRAWAGIAAEVSVQGARVSLGHLRGPGPHVRGCWAVDLLLAKV